MAELTPLDEKLAEVLGLAQAAQQRPHVASMEGAEDFKARSTHERAGAETERRTDGYIDTLEGRKTAIREQARETKSEAVDMMKTYLGGEEEALDGFEFLSMAEAGELCHWEIVQMIADGRRRRGDELADWAVDVQRGTSRPCARPISRSPPKRRRRWPRPRLVRIAGEGEPEARGPRRRRSARAPRRTRAAARPRTPRRPRARARMSPAIPNDGSVGGPAASAARSRCISSVRSSRKPSPSSASRARGGPSRPTIAGRDPERPRHRAVDALGDPAHAVLVDQLDEPGGLQALDVVVDGLRRVAEHLADLRARARLGELAQDLDALGLQQRVGLLDRLDVERVQHLQTHLVRQTVASCKR